MACTPGVFFLEIKIFSWPGKRSCIRHLRFVPPPKSNDLRKVAWELDGDGTIQLLFGKNNGKQQNKRVEKSGEEWMKNSFFFFLESA